jgi:hypothetical protein
MLEILFLIWFVRKLGSMAREKGRSSGWGALGILGWVGGEFTGFIIGGIADAGVGGSYGLALLCAAVGAGGAYAIVSMLGNERARYDFGPSPAGPAAPYAPYDPSNPYNAPRT